MDLTAYRTLGRSGLVVSPLALGTMTFGAARWGSDEAASAAVFDAYVEAGGNFVDTADVYSGGQSEEAVGRLVAERGLRDHVVIATKAGFYGARTAGGSNPNGGGNGRKHVMAALDRSLRRLGTDYVDLYWMHVWDAVTPVDEVLQTLGDLVRAGKIRYFGLSDGPAWAATKTATLASERGVPGPVALQPEYSLVERSVEREHVPAALDGGMGIVPWSPLAGGFLTGKYTRSAAGPEGDGRLAGANPFGDSKFTDRNWAVLDVLRAVASEAGRTPAETALAWTLARPGVASLIVGARTPDQLAANVASLSVVLTPEQTDRLDRASALAPDFSSMMGSPGLKAAVFGGAAVEGWR